MEIQIYLLNLNSRLSDKVDIMFRKGLLLFLSTNFCKILLKTLIYKVTASTPLLVSKTQGSSKNPHLWISFKEDGS